MNSFTSSLNTEPALMVNLGYTKNAFIYAGGGVNFGIVASIVDNQDVEKVISEVLGCVLIRLRKHPK